MKYHITALVIFIVSISGCKKFVEVPPPYTQLVSASVYSTDAMAYSSVTGIYETIVRNSIGGNTNGLSALLGLSADEFKLFPTTNTTAKQVYSNELLSNSFIPFWKDLYNCIYQTNIAIEGLSASSRVTPSLKQQLIGEAKFMRAFCHFYLVNIYGEIPLVTTTNFKINSNIAKSSTTIVYNQIVADLEDAQSLLSDDYKSPDELNATTRVRPNKGATTALLARVYLYLGKWDKAEAQSTTVINNSNYQLLPDLNNVFLAENNSEAIWQLESPNNGFNAPDGNFLLGFVSTSGPSPGYPFLLSDSLVNEFETGDLRKANWTVSKTVSDKTYYFPYKYKLNNTNQPPVEYEMLLRLSEQYLIRAEVRAQQGNLAGAKDDLNVIRTRAGLPNTTASSQSELLAAIMRERYFELFTEYGHRWFDLKRTGNANAIMDIITPLKGGTWQTTDQLYPIPLTEIQANQNLVQNPGYN
jgi:hypothetical protein